MDIIKAVAKRGLELRGAIYDSGSLDTVLITQRTIVLLKL